MPAILEGQPHLYESLLPSFFKSEIPAEEKATCSNCAMCASNSQSLKPVSANENPFFLESTKCCTFHPNLPNYLVGAILSDETPEGAEGKKRILEKIAARRGVNPMGVNAPAKYNLLYKNSREFFGRAPSMRCPYYMDEGGGLCSVWRYREAVCSTYFCKHVAGADGKKFWMSVKSYLAQVEMQLTRFALFKLYPDYLVNQKHLADIGGDVIHQTELEEGPPSPSTYKKSWGSWEGLEADFFKECYQLVLKARAKDFEHIMGLDGEIALATVEKNYGDAVSPKIPNRIKLNPDLKIQWTDRESVVIGGYSELDALELPSEAYTLLKEFKGMESVPETRVRIRKEHGSDFSDELIRTFFQHRILIEVA
jgi:hypothetical protein